MDTKTDLMSSPFGCFFPLNAVAIHPQGTKKFCLTSTLSAEEDGNEFRRQQREVHRQLVQGTWPESCRSCRRQESLGLQSRRQRTWQRKALIYGEDRLREFVGPQARAAFRHVEISFSNICNLNCAMCSSEFSSRWISEDQKAVASGLEFREFTRKFQKIQRVSQEFLNSILQQSGEIDLLIIKGGEPTLDPQCLDFLQQLGEIRKDNPVHVFLQTNGTRPPAEWLSALQGVRLDIGFSVDGWGPVYEWIRGTSFERVLEHFLYLAEQPRVESLGIDFTLSLFNCIHLPEFLERVIELKKRLPKLNSCAFFQWAQEPYARPDSLPLALRESVADKAKSLFDTMPDLFLNSENILKVLTLKQGDEAQRHKARRWIEFMNEIRGQSLYDLQPFLLESL